MLNKGLSLVSKLMLEHLGVPATLRQFLAENARRLRVPSLDVPPGAMGPWWHGWGQASRANGTVFKAGEILGWTRHRNFGYRSYRVVRPELASFGCCVRISGGLGDFQNATGPGALKSELVRFASLNAVVGEDPRSRADDLATSQRSLRLAHGDIREPSRPKSLVYIAHHLWNGQAFQINSGELHHFAAARDTAGRTGHSDPWCRELHVFSIEPLAVSGLRRDFELFAVSRRDAAANVGLHDAMRKLRATYFCRPLPYPYGSAEALFLPRDEKRSMALAAELRKAGLPDLGKHLSTLVLRQHINLVHHDDTLQLKAA
jgi:hypothetical protein